MKNTFVKRFATGLVLCVLVWGIAAYLAGCYTLPGMPTYDPDAPGPQSAPGYPPGIYLMPGGTKMVFPTGSEIEVQSGGTIDIQSGATTDVGGALGVTGAGTFAGIVSIGTFLRIPLEPAIAVTDDSIITPTGTMQQLSAVGNCGTANIAAGTDGDWLVLFGPAANTITLTDTATLMLNANRALSAHDVLVLTSDGTNWREMSFTDN